MSKLTLDEAIKHYLESAEEQSRLYSLCPCPCDGTKNCMCLKNGKDIGCTKLAAEHRQLAEWLTELKDLREENKVLTSECDRLIKEKGELNELKEKAVLDICRREARLRDAKRLLKLAVEDFETIESNLEYDEHCVIKTHSIRCDECPLSAATIYRCKWRYADEALALIGEDGDTNG